MASESKSMLHFTGAADFRQRVILATLSQKSMTIKEMRTKDQNPGKIGIMEYEVNLMKLMSALTNGTSLVFSKTGTRMKYTPGMLIGGTVVHDCNPDRSIGYYLGVLACLAPFMKTDLNITLRGVTHDNVSYSVDCFKLTTLPFLARFIGTDEGLDLQIRKRGATPLTDGDKGGEVVFRCPTRSKLVPMQFTVSGKVKRIRGVAWSTRVDGRMCSRLIKAAKEFLHGTLSDIYITAEARHGDAAGKSPGYGITLIGETTGGVFYCGEECSVSRGEDDVVGKICTPEDVGAMAAQKLCFDIYGGGCVDTSNTPLACLMMTLSSNVSKILTGELDNPTLHMLRNIRDVFSVTFKIDSQPQANPELALGGEKLLLTCRGIGLNNYGKQML